MEQIFLCETPDNVVSVFGRNDQVFCKADILKGGFEDTRYIFST